jgi:glycosyltransferase involved in cell wall biosynthesis
MTTTSQPLVNVVTPVYNGEKYLAKCIESVLSQTYRNWQYTIVNNCSTDNTEQIATRYAATDARITVINNKQFVGVIENHNIAFSLVPSDSKYCKVVCADDWIYPECIACMVELAEDNPSTGIVGAYVINARGVASIGLPYDQTVFSGREVCRAYLLGDLDAFATPSAVLYRSDLVRSYAPFFPGSAPSADLSAGLVSLQKWDFGFVHQVLSFQRIHLDAISLELEKLHSFMVDRLDMLAEYGPIFLTETERKTRQAYLLREYYRYLALGLVNFEAKEFWNFHKCRLERLGQRLSWARLMLAVLEKSVDLLGNPKQTAEKVLRRMGTKGEPRPRFD